MHDQPASERDAQRLAIWEAVPSKAWVTLSQGTFLRGFLLERGVGNFALGILDNLPIAVLLLQPALSLLFARATRPRRVTLTAITVERLLVVAPLLIVLALKWQTVPTWVLMSLGVAYMAGALALNGWVLVLGRMTGGGEAGQFVARRSQIEAATSMLVGLAAAPLLDLAISRGQSALGYACIFGGAGLVSVASFWMMRRLLATDRVREIPEPPRAERLLLPWRDARYRKFLLFAAWLTFGQSLSGPYWTVYLLKELEWSYTEVTLYGTVITLAALACYNFWGRLADPVGATPLIRFLLLARVINPILWLFLTRDNAWVLLGLEGLFTGLLTSGVTPLLLTVALKGAPAEEKTIYLGSFHTTLGAATLVGALAGASLTGLGEALHHPWGPFVLTIYHISFLVTAGVRLVAPRLLRGVHEPGAARLREVGPAIWAALNERSAKSD